MRLFLNEFCESQLVHGDRWLGASSILIVVSTMIGLLSIFEFLLYLFLLVNF